MAECKKNLNRNVQITKRYILCPVCDAKDYEIYFEDELGDSVALVDYDFKPETQKVYQIVKCRGCGFIYTNPIPSLDTEYAENVDNYYMQSTDQRRRTALVNINTIKKFKSKGHILDIGCATGVFLDIASDSGFITEGIELSKWAREISSARHKVYDKPLSELNFINKYDIISLWGVVEHFSDPGREIESAFRALKPEGCLFIYTGDVSSITAKLMGRRWYWFMGMHLMYFSEDTLKQLLKKKGFKDLLVKRHVSYFSLNSLAKSMNRYKLLFPLVKLLSMKFLSGIFVPIYLPGEMLMIAKKPL